MKTGWNEFCFEDVFARFKADTSVSEESKDFIASRVFNHRIFSREWDARYGNPPDPMLIRPQIQFVPARIFYMHDFACTQASDILNPVLRERVRYLKESEGGR